MDTAVTGFADFDDGYRLCAAQGSEAAATLKGRLYFVAARSRSGPGVNSTRLKESRICKKACRGCGPGRRQCQFR
jgi:hypothetical protein